MKDNRSSDLPIGELKSVITKAKKWKFCLRQQNQFRPFTVGPDGLTVYSRNQSKFVKLNFESQ